MWLTVKEVAEKLGISDKTVRRRLKKSEWVFKSESNPNGGKDIILIYLDINSSQLDPSEQLDTSIGQADKSEEETPLFFDDQLDKITKTNKKAEALAQPGVQKPIGQLDKVNETPLNSPNHNRTPSKAIGQVDKSTAQLDSPEQLDMSIGQAVNNFDQFSTKLPTTIDPLKWIPLDRAVALSGLSRRTIYNRIESRELISITVPDKVSKTRTLISIDGFSDMVKRRWELEVLDGNRALGDLLEAEKNEFNVHSQAEREKAWQRKAIIDKYLEYKKLAKLRGEKLGRADHEFEIKLNTGEILPFILKKMEVESISIKTLKKWEKKYRDSGDSAYPVSLLEQKRGVVGRKPLVTNQVKNLIVNVSKARISWDSTEVMTIVKNKLAEKGLKLQISQRTLFNIMKETRKDVLGMSALEGPEGYKNKARPHTIRINNALPGQIWESDGKHSSVPVFSPFYREKPEYSVIFKPVVVWWIDIATKAITGCAVGKTETGNLVRNALRDGIEHFGLPEHIRTDNAKSYRNIAFAPEEFIYKKRDTKGKQRALKMLDSGDLGMYKNIGIKEYHFTIPKNSESKMIEPFWKWCFSKFEDKFPVYFGRKPEEREEMLKMTNRELCVKFSNAIPTLEEFEELLKGFIHMWNTSTELCTINRNIEGKVLSPIEAYNLKDKVVPSQATLDRYMRDPYLREVKVQRDGIYVGGIYYRHAIFASLIGKKILYYYDERNIWSVKIASTMGEYYDEPARAFVAGYQYDDDMSSLRDTRRYEKHGIGYYLALRATGAKSMKEVQKVLRAPVEELIADQDRLHTKQKDSYTSLDYKPRDKKIELLPENEIIVTEEDIIKAQVNEQEYIETEDTELDEIRRQIAELDNQEEEEDQDWSQAWKEAGLN